jgi:hypothetical protein
VRAMMCRAISVLVCFSMPPGLRAYRSIPEHRSAGMRVCLRAHHHPVNENHAPWGFA